MLWMEQMYTAILRRYNHSEERDQYSAIAHERNEKDAISAALDYDSALPEDIIFVTKTEQVTDLHQFPLTTIFVDEFSNINIIKNLAETTWFGVWDSEECDAHYMLNEVKLRMPRFVYFGIVVDILNLVIDLGPKKETKAGHDCLVAFNYIKRLAAGDDGYEASKFAKMANDSYRSSPPPEDLVPGAINKFIISIRESLSTEHRPQNTALNYTFQASHHSTGESSRQYFSRVGESIRTKVPLRKILAFQPLLYPPIGDI